MSTPVPSTVKALKVYYHLLTMTFVQQPFFPGRPG